MEKYQKLYSHEENLYAKGSPVVLVAGALQKNNETGKIFAQLKFRNIVDETIRALQVTIHLADVFGNDLGEIEYLYQDYSAKRNNTFGDKEAIYLENGDVRTFFVEIEKIAFENGKSWERDDTTWTKILPQENAEKVFGEELSKQYRMKYGNLSRYLAKADRDLILCACGLINKSHEVNCRNCGAKLSDLLNVDVAALEAEKEARLAEEARIKEEAWAAAEKQAKEARDAAEAATKKAKKVRKNICLIIACVLIAIGVALLTLKVIIPNISYNAALKLMNNEQYEEAIVAFEALDGYKDSADNISSCQMAMKDREYDAAVALMNNEQYEEAIVAFEALDDYRDSKGMIVLCEDALSDIKYCEALNWLENGLVTEAFDIFKKLGDYKDSKQKVKELSKNLMVNPDTKYGIGDELTLGRYEQNNNLSDGKEDIEWLILDIKDNKALIISKYALDCKQFNSIYENVTWDNCTLRQWLNSTFISQALSSEEQTIILDTLTHETSSDKLFVISIQDADKYFHSDEARKCIPTPYAKSQGAYTNNLYVTATGEAACSWWLRSPVDTQNYAACISVVGSIYYDGLPVDHTDASVRPAMWVEIAGEKIGNKQTNTKTDSTSSFGKYLSESKSIYTENDFSTTSNSAPVVYKGGTVLSAGDITYEISADGKNIYCRTKTGGCDVWKDGALVKKDYIVKAVPSLRLRKEPNTSSAILDEVTYTSRVTVEYVRDGWGYATINGKSGWMSMDYLDEPYIPNQYSGEKLQVLNVVKEHANWIEGVIEKDYLFASYSTKNTGHDWQINKDEYGYYVGQCYLWNGATSEVLYSFSVYKNEGVWVVNDERTVLTTVLGNTIDSVVEDTEYKSAILENDFENRVAMIDYIKIAGELYKLWDNALNTIWGKLTNKLDSATMSALVASQREWINEKETALSQIDSQYGGSSARFDECYVPYTMTRDRVYYLVQHYNK